MTERLLIVDDEEAILVAMQEYFFLFGFAVDCARRKDEALALLERQRYAAVIADVRLTGSQSTEGLDVVREARERWPATRIIVLTAHGTPTIEAEARALAVDAYLQKPRPLSELALLLAGLLLERR